MLSQEFYTLYRGDYTKIVEFDFNKTDKFCHVGPGIYLTDSLRVAESYRDKGSYTTNLTTLFNGHAKDRKDAYDRAFFSYLTHTYDNMDSLNCRAVFRQILNLKYKEKFQLNDVLNTDLPKQALNNIKEIYSQYQDDVRQKRIVADYVTKVGNDAVIRVIYNCSNKVGFITRFDFPRHEFETSVFKIDTAVKDEFFWELIWDNGIPFGRDSVCKDSFIKSNSNSWSIDLSIDLTRRNMGVRNRRWSRIELFKSIREMLTPYGYRGFEYSGGTYIGGCGKHRAFCIWEDNFVNQYKTERFK
jgi:hypothetical protein